MKCVSFHPQAFVLLCDLLLLYSASSAHVEPALQTLVHLPSDSLRSELAAFLLDYVFSDTEDDELDGISVNFRAKHCSSTFTLTDALLVTLPIEF